MFASSLARSRLECLRPCQAWLSAGGHRPGLLPDQPLALDGKRARGDSMMSFWRSRAVFARSRSAFRHSRHSCSKVPDPKRRSYPVTQAPTRLAGARGWWCIVFVAVLGCRSCGSTSIASRSTPSTPINHPAFLAPRTRREATGNPFTGFDDTDNLRIISCAGRDAGPLSWRPSFINVAPMSLRGQARVQRQGVVPLRSRRAFEAALWFTVSADSMRRRRRHFLGTAVRFPARQPAPIWAYHSSPPLAFL